MSRVITDGGFFHAMNAERSDEMAVFRIERTRDYTVMSNHHLRDKALSLKSKGLLSMMLSLPEDWNYTTRGLAKICKEGVDAIGGALRELEAAGYIVRHQMRDRQGRISDTEYVIYEQPQPKEPDTPQPDTASPDTENPYLDDPDTEKPAELNIEKSKTQKQTTDVPSTDSIPFHVFSYTRNGLFYVPIFLVMGTKLKVIHWREKKVLLILGASGSLFLMVLEGLFLHKLGVQRHDSMYFLLIPSMFFLFQLALAWDKPSAKTLRTMSMWIYLFYPFWIVAVRGFAKVIHLETILVDNSLIHYRDCLVWDVK